MPTGYTADIKDGISFKQFALNCARAFGALITMRDDPPDAKIPEEFKPSTYHQEKIEELRKELRNLDKMTLLAASKAAERDWGKTETRRLEAIAEANALREKYLAMRAEIIAWTPPTPEHVELKKFMLEQVDNSISFDCHTKYFETPTPIQGPVEWLDAQRERIHKSIKYHTEAHEKEVASSQGRTVWVQALRNSLKDKP
jgi:hypothetical protein